MQIINLFGAPCSGKSTAAAGLFYKMKIENYSVELVTEVAKDLVWSKRYKCLENQVKVTVDQYERMRRLENQVDYVITDSPLLLGIIYQREEYFKSFTPLVHELFNSFNNSNIFIRRSKKYVQTGRNETEDESKQIAFKIEDILRDNNYAYKDFKGTRNIAQIIYGHLKIRNVI